MSGGGPNGPTNFLRDTYSSDEALANGINNTISDMLYLDNFADWSWQVGNHCLPTRDRVFAGMKIIGTAALLAGGGVIGRGIGRGIGAGARLLRSASGGGEVFWSGGGAAGPARAAAAAFAESNGLRTLEMTPAAKALEAARIPWNHGGKEAWRALSDQFSRNASGEVHVFLHGPVSPTSTWRTIEYINILWNSSVRNVITHIVP